MSKSLPLNSDEALAVIYVATKSSHDKSLEEFIREYRDTLAKIPDIMDALEENSEEDFGSQI
jgi:hypothetical protein